MIENEPLPFFNFPLCQEVETYIEDTRWQMQLVYDVIKLFSEITYKMQM